MPGRTHEGSNVGSDELPELRSRPRLDLAIQLAIFSSLLLLYAFTTGAVPHWLDCPELVTAAHTLGVPHPPGHPLYVLVAKLVALLVPLGSVAFRVSLVSALGAAGMGVIAYRLGRSLLPEGTPPLLGRLLAAGAALVVGTCPSVWLQAVRAEVYTLHGVVVLGMLHLLVVGRDGVDEREAVARLAGAVFLAGLGMANHHYLLFLALPAALALALGTGSLRRRLSVRRLGGLVLLGLVAVVPLYAFIGIRAGLPLEIDWARPGGLAALYDLVSAKIFQASVAAAPSTGLGDNLVALVFFVMDQVTPAVVLVALVGLYSLVRSRPVVGLALALAIMGNMASKAFMVLDPFNPDAHGYLLLTVTATVLLASRGVAVLVVAALDEGRAARGTKAVKAVVTGLAVMLMWALVPLGVANGITRVGTQCFIATEAVYAMEARATPPGGVVVHALYMRTFNAQYFQVVEGRRPDTVTVLRSFDALRDGGSTYAAYLAAKAPSLAGLADAFLQAGTFPVEAAQALAEVRPVLFVPSLEPGPSAGDLVSRCMLLELSPAGSDLTEAPCSYGPLYDTLGLPGLEDRATRMVLLAHHHSAAMLLAAGGDHHGALAETMHGLMVNPMIGQLLDLLAKELLVDTLATAADGARGLTMALAADPGLAPLLPTAASFWLVNRGAAWLAGAVVSAGVSWGQGLP